MTPQTNGRITHADLASLPTVLDVPTAAQLLGISRSVAYQLAADDRLPVPVLRVGRSLRIPTAPLLALINPTTTQPPATPPGHGAPDGGPDGGVGRGGDG